ncbi:MAG: methionyl-tRNA formyltransferase [Actinomycetota bacterium]
MIFLNTVFLGSGGFSRDLLDELLRSGFEISAVFTRPDHPAGRGLHRRPTPVKAFAKLRGLRVFQPDGPRDPLFTASLGEVKPELMLVADYGYLLPARILGYTAKGCLNVHPSLLPRYRGAAPIQRALMRGEAVTGVSLMVMDEGMDTGDVIAVRELAIADSDSALTLRRKLATLGAGLLLETLPPFLAGDIPPVPQDEAMATYADPIRKEDTVIDWTRTAADIHNQVRALSPRPGAYTLLRGKRVKVLRTLPRPDVAAGIPGELLPEGKEGVAVGTGGGALQLLEVQPEGKKAMSAGEFRRGYRPARGEVFLAPGEAGTN